MKDNHANTAPAREALESNRELAERAIARLEFVRDTIGDMASASDNRRQEIADSNLSAIENAQGRLAMLHNEMDLIRENGKGSPCAEPASKIDTDDRVYELQIYLEDIEGIASIVAEACDEAALQGVFNTIERECAAVREGLDDFLGLSGKAALSEIDRLASEYAEKTPQECAARLRQFNYDVAENLAASMSEDGYTVTKTWTPKGIRYFLAEREFLESLLPDDAS